MANNNLIDERGKGDWQFYTYNPARLTPVISGKLVVTQSYHLVYATDGTQDKMIASIPSQNVAYVFDTRFVKDN
jgi:hypothetical protein